MAEILLKLHCSPNCHLHLMIWNICRAFKLPPNFTVAGLKDALVQVMPINKGNPERIQVVWIGRWTDFGTSSRLIVDRADKEQTVWVPRARWPDSFNHQESGESGSSFEFQRNFRFGRDRSNPIHSCRKKDDGKWSSLSRSWSCNSMLALAVILHWMERWRWGMIHSGCGSVGEKGRYSTALAWLIDCQERPLEFSPDGHIAKNANESHVTDQSLTKSQQDGTIDGTFSTFSTVLAWVAK